MQIPRASPRYRPPVAAPETPLPESRAKITAGELVVVLSHYDLGVIHSVRRYRGGSRQSPKVLITSSEGEFLLKRRGGGDAQRPDPAILARVQRAHVLHAHLSRAGFPVPQLLIARSGSTIVRVDTAAPHAPTHASGGVYELYRFVRGARYARSTEHARAAGALLADFHTHTTALSIEPPPPAGGFHNRSELAASFEAVREHIADPRARPVCRSLETTYLVAAEHAERLGVSRRQSMLIHADWHPGNLIFKSPPPPTAPAPPTPGVLSVVDLDSLRLAPRLLDIANGAMQFSILRSVAEPGKAEAGESTSTSALNADAARPWRIVFSPELLTAFCEGYRRATRIAPDTDDWLALPWLMCQALIVEAVTPIAFTGAFGRLDPLPLLALVDKTASAIIQERDRLVTLAAGD